MKIAVIGGSGFVGTRLIDILISAGQYNLLNIDKNVSEKFPDISVIGNVMDKDTLISQLQGTDVVVLLAAEHRDDVAPVSLYYDVNVKGMRNTLEAMEANNVKRIIFTSSVAIYGLDKNNPDESFPADPFNHYGKSKWDAEQLLQEWYKKT
ncbi:NAD-dependent epimerase/dehydratase family protein [Elizabethkingia miricola]|uniref:NAD-dependent epimerase/dehydratase family protein n=1 Tax=Elizabethkingia miricola TaxID=172045 RepID=UPI0028898B8D|nr:NAD-dependent epimerase/dehydratase family protein [Elizabethkingia miricola]